jgi:endonuclease/exonuclease/phosphatase family metal-dependent hydrolase
LKKIILITFVLIFTINLSALRVLTYNALNFSSNSGDRLPYFQSIFNDVESDIVLVQEMSDEGGAELLLTALNNGGNNFSKARFLDGPDTENMLFYNNAIVNFASQDTIDTQLRDISEYELLLEGNLIRFYSCHLRASQGNELLRLVEVTRLRDHLNLLEEGSEFIIAGDMNFYTSAEPGYQKFIADETNNIGRAQDLSDQVGSWNNNPVYAAAHTQSTRVNAFGGGAGGGLDDRFDFIFSSYEINNGNGLEYIEDSLTPFGNDGNHFNQSINAGTNSAVSPEIADALYYASDHLPVYADFNVIPSAQEIIVVTIPNIEEQWEQDSTQEIKWTSANFFGNIKIELELIESSSREILIASTENDGIWEWNIPVEQTLGEYIIVVSDSDDSIPSDVSNNPFSIIEPLSVVAIYDIQYSLTGPSPLEGTDIVTCGIVTGVFDSGYFIQDGAGAWNGIYIYNYSNDPQRGDSLIIAGTVAEYYDKTELNNISFFEVKSGNNSLPEAIVLNTGDVGQESYEGVLVKVENAECIEYNAIYGEWIVDDGSGEIMINDLMFVFVPVLGEFYDITGIVDYSYSNFKIEPRDENDIIISSSSIDKTFLHTQIELFNYPNPFNPKTTFYFTAEDSENAELIIYNLKGQKIRQYSIFNLQSVSAGLKSSIMWDGTDENKQPVSSGIYFYKLRSGENSKTKKMLLLK